MQVSQIDGDAGQPEVSGAVGRQRHEFDPGKRGERGAVVLKVAPSLRDAFGEGTELATPDGREHIAHPLIKTERRVLIMRGRITSLLLQENVRVRSAARHSKQAFRRRKW